MVELWIPIVLVAAALQTARNAGQKHLSAVMSPWSATWVRFAFGLPFAAGYLWWTTAWYGLQLPAIRAAFLVPAVLAAILQIMATALLVYLFTLRNFAVGSTYVRTEAILAAIVGTVFFAESIDLWGWVAVVISVTGVVMLSLAHPGLGNLAGLTAGVNLSAGVGIAAGLTFALASFFIRRASLSFDLPNQMFTASITLIAVVSLQTAMLGAFIAVARPHELRLIAQRWRPSLVVGATSAFGSMGWFTAMTMQRVAYVKALAQVEFLFALGVSMLLFHERSTSRELLGMALIALGVVVLVLFAR